MIKPAFWEKTQYEIKVYSPDWESELKSFCEKASTEKKRAAINMEYEKIAHIIEREKRFDGGEFLLFQVGGETVAVSGFHPMDKDPQTFVCGVRTYTLSKFEHFGIHSNFLLPYQLKKVFQNPQRQALMVFNDYNKKIFLFVESLVELLKKQMRLDLKVVPLPRQMPYKNTLQYGVLIYLDPIRTENLAEWHHD